MSRIGNKPIEIPDNVNIKIQNNEIEISGPKGVLSQKYNDSLKLELKEKKLYILPSDKQYNSAYHGTMRSIIQNIVQGVVKGFEKHLYIEGVGYRASVQNNKLILQLGYSHPIEMEIPSGITIQVKDNINIIVQGVDKQQVGQIAAKIRDYKKPEPYKGKGIRYIDERIRRKVGKTGV